MGSGFTLEPTQPGPQRRPPPTLSGWKSHPAARLTNGRLRYLLTRPRPPQTSYAGTYRLRMAAEQALCEYLERQPSVYWARVQSSEGPDEIKVWATFYPTPYPDHTAARTAIAGVIVTIAAILCLALLTLYYSYA